MAILWKSASINASRCKTWNLVLFLHTFLYSNSPFFFCAFQVLLSCWLFATHHWVQTQHLDHWGCFRKQRRERESDDRVKDTSFLDVLKLWNSEWICTSLVSPRTFFPLFCTHIHTSFPTKPCLNDSYLFWTTKTFTWTKKGGEKSKRNYIKPPYNDQPRWTLERNTDVKSPTRTKLWKKNIKITKKKKKKQPQKKPQTKNIIADCRRRSFIKIVWSNWVLKTNF